MSLSTRRAATGWQALPQELRLQIYRQSWEPRSVFVGVRSTQANALNGRASEANNAPQLPVTLHLNYEAREEMLKNYKRLQLIYLVNLPDAETEPQDGETEFRSLNNYINPSLDVLHLDHLCLEDSPSLMMEAIRPASLHVALGRDIDVYFATKLFHYQVLPGIPTIFDGIQTIDFWVTRREPDSNRNSPHPEGTFPMTFRYRICRTSQAPKTKLVSYQDSRWRPVEFHDFNCNEPGCANQSSVWRWVYHPEENKPWERSPVASTYYLEPDDQEPKPNRRLKIPGAACHWVDVDVRRILKHDGALIFDSGGTESSYSSDGHDFPRVNREWSVLRVMPPTLWGKEVVERAWQHLGVNHPLGGGSYFPPENEGDPHPDDDCENDWSYLELEPTPEQYLHPGMQLHPDMAFRMEVIPLFHNILHFSGTSLESVQCIQGVCLPGYQMDGSCITALLGSETKYPVVSDKLEEEVMTRTGVDLEMEDLALRNEFEVWNLGGLNFTAMREKVWHGCKKAI